MLNGTFSFGTGVDITGSSTGGFNAILVKYDNDGTAVWAKTSSSGSLQSFYKSLAIDLMGNVYTVGYQSGSGTLTYGTGVSISSAYTTGFNSIIVKYDSSGTPLWAKGVNTASNQSEFNAVAASITGEIYAAGYQHGNSGFNYGNGITVQGTYASGKNAVLVRYDQNGNTHWATSVTQGANLSEFNGVSVDMKGNVYVVGVQNGNQQYTYGSVAAVSGPSSSGNNCVIVKYSSLGIPNWAKSSISSSNYGSVFQDVNTDNSGNIFSSGYISGSSIIHDFGNSVTATGIFSAATFVVVKYHY